MKRSSYDRERRFQTIGDACRTTGLSQYYLRKGCKDGSIPHVRSGRVYMVDVVSLYEALENQQKQK